MISKFLNDKQSGFTIIEVLVIVVVIAILAGIAIVAYPAYQERARDTKRKSDLHNIISGYKGLLTERRLDENFDIIAYDDARWIFPNFSPSPSSPTLAGNDSFPGGPGGVLGQQGYLKENAIDPSSPAMPTESSGVISYSGYIVIQCWNPKEGFYGIAKLERPSSEEVSNFNNFLDTQVNGIPNNGYNPSNTNSCFYSPEGDNAYENAYRNHSDNTSIRQMVKSVLSNPNNGYNYIVKIK